MAKKKETKSQKEKRLEKMKSRISEIEKRKQMEKKLEDAEKKLKKLRKEKKITPIERTISKTAQALSDETGVQLQGITQGTRTFGKSQALSGVRTPISNSEKMWVVSWWENRKILDPNFDIDNWFKSSVQLDIPERQRQIENFWTGRGEEDTTDFWTGTPRTK